MKTNIFQEIKALSSNSDEYLFIEDQEGNLHPITAGKIGKVVKKSSKGELYGMIFGKERIGLDEIRAIEEIDFSNLKHDLIKLLYENLTYKLKKEAQTELKELIQKYGLKELAERKRKA